RLRQEDSERPQGLPPVAGDDEAYRREEMADSGRHHARRHHRQAPRSRLRERQPPWHAEDQELPLGRLRGRRLPLQRRQEDGRLAAARPLQRRRPARPCRLHLVAQGRREESADREARKADRPARLHRRQARRPEPLVDQALVGVATAQAEARGRGLLRSFLRRPVPPRPTSVALAAGQGAAAVHDGAGGGREASGLDEVAEVALACPGRDAARSTGVPGLQCTATRRTAPGTRLSRYCGNVPFCLSTSPARYSEPVISTRGGGSRSSLRTASNASAMLSRLVADRPMPRAVSASASAGTLFSEPGTGTAIMRRASPVKLRRKPSQSLLASMPTIITSGRDTRSSRSAKAAATARPPSGLCPPSSQTSLPAGARST